MFNDVEAMELLCRGHALEWTGKGWRTIFEPEHVAPISIQESGLPKPPGWSGRRQPSKRKWLARELGRLR